MRILIVEDDSITSECLNYLCKEYLGTEIQSIKVLHSLMAAECYLKENPIDLLFLDINVKGELGFDLLELAIKNSFYTIVVSSDKGNAVKAFEYNVLDFMAKPFTRERFEAAMVKMKNGVAGGNRAIDAISIKGDGCIDLVHLKQISYFQSRGNYTILHLQNKNTTRVRKTLESISRSLSTEFIRIHRSYIVRISEIQRIIFMENNKYRIELRQADSLPLSRANYTKLKTLLN